MNEPYIKLYKKLINWRWYKSPNVIRMFLHCLLKANWKDGYFEEQLIKRGSFVTSLKQLSEELGMTIQEVRTALKTLCEANKQITQFSTQELTKVTTPKFTIITVNNYDLYQQPNTETNTQGSRNLTTIEEEISNISNYIISNFGRTMSPIEYEKLNQWLEIFSEDIIKHAISECCVNNVKTIRYLETILYEWQKAGYKTLEECKNHFQNKSKKLLNASEEPTKELFDWDWLNNEE